MSDTSYDDDNDGGAGSRGGRRRRRRAFDTPAQYDRLSALPVEVLMDAVSRLSFEDLRRAARTGRSLEEACAVERGYRLARESIATAAATAVQQLEDAVFADPQATADSRFFINFKRDSASFLAYLLARDNAVLQNLSNGYDAAIRAGSADALQDAINYAREWQFISRVGVPYASTKLLPWLLALVAGSEPDVVRAAMVTPLSERPLVITTFVMTGNVAQSKRYMCESTRLLDIGRTLNHIEGMLRDSKKAYIAQLPVDSRDVTTTLESVAVNVILDNTNVVMMRYRIT